MDASAPLGVSLLGRFRVLVHGRAIPDEHWRQRRAAGVVKLLSLAPGHRLHREQLIETLWPDLDGEAAANNLRVALSRARRVLEAHDADPGRFLIRDGAMYALADSDDAWIDIDAFESAVRRAWASSDPDASRVAVDAYGGDLLPDDLYEEWAAGPRLALRASYLSLLARLARLYEEREAFRHAIAVWQRLLDADPLDEPAHAALMTLFARVGETRQARVQFQRLTALLAEELDEEPDAATRNLAEAIRAGHYPKVGDLEASGSSAQGDSGALARASRPVRCGNLPVPPDALIGRDREMEEVQRLIAARRLVSIVGPAGVGKTRLALAAGAVAARAHSIRAVWVDLAPLRDPMLVLPTIARALDVGESADGPLASAVADRLNEEPLLLVIDNVEHVLAAAPDLANLLANSPDVRLIVTSRAPMRIRAEQAYPLAPLAVPEAEDIDRLSDAEVRQRSPAVALFERRTAEARPGRVLSRGDLAAVAEICRRLDGLPLAIELAAARSRLVPVGVLRQSLARPLVMLTDGARDAPDRQQTLRAAISWSYDLLDASAQAVFRGLGVFAGGFTLDAAAAIAAPGTSLDGPSATPAAILNTVSDLVDQGLVGRDEGVEDDPRFTMLLTIRDFARDRLGASGGLAELGLRHAAWFLDLAERAEPELNGSDAETRLRRLECEHDNLRAALATFAEREISDDRLRLAAALWRFWWRRGYLSEGRAQLERALEGGSGAPAPLRAKALNGAGALASAQGDLEQATALHAAALDLWRAAGDREGMANALINLGLAADESGAPRRAEAWLTEALRLARAAGYRRGVAMALANLGQAAMTRQDLDAAAASLMESAGVFAELGDEASQTAVLANLGVLAFMAGDFARAESWHEAALTAMRKSGDRHGEAAELLNLGHTVQQGGDLERAGGLYAESLAAFRQLGDRHGEAMVVIHLGRLALLAGEGAAAAAHLRAGFDLAQGTQDRAAVVEAVEGLALLAGMQGDAARCARLLAAAAATREHIGTPLPAVHRPAIVAGMEEARRVLGPAAFATAEAEGREIAASERDGAAGHDLSVLTG